MPLEVARGAADFMKTSSNGNIFRVTGLLYGNSLVTGEFPSQRPVTRSFDVFFAPEQRLSKQSRRWLFQTRSRRMSVSYILKNRSCNTHALPLNRNGIFTMKQFLFISMDRLVTFNENVKFQYPIIRMVFIAYLLHTRDIDHRSYIDSYNFIIFDISGEMTLQFFADFLFVGFSS